MFVINLQHALDHKDVGSKAANLGRAMEIGLPVPRGIVVTRQALSLFHEGRDLLPRVRRVIEGSGVDRTARASEYAALCEDVAKAPIPEPVAEEVEPMLTAADLPQIALIRDPATSRALVEKRRREFERNQRLTPPAFLGARPAADETPVSASSPAAESNGDGSILTGRGITPWSATGVACTVSDLNDPAVLASLTPETILVCDGSSISYHSDWTSLFLVVAGLVIVGTHRGMHHAIQIARECGVAFIQLPAAELTALDGMRVAIVGKAGTVTLVEEPE